MGLILRFFYTPSPQLDRVYRLKRGPAPETGSLHPAEAVKYQILVLFLIAGGTGLGAVTAVLGGVYRLTDGRHRLRLDRLRPPKPA